ncbi:hypothetical protein Bca52824_035421 [Brassica carinata]|uniref:Uncharacterized protein n=1 Tax=Brassica carinata TaxID=52824 RepID=A0A8X7V1P3_BRACI|nr:hypothetical protein Bca52824_035421 [Brassica carinata]
MHGGEVSSIKGPGRSSSTVERFREARNVRCGGEFMGVDMLLLDSQTTMMAATVNVNQLPTHMPNMKAGSVYSLTGFDVTRSPNPPFQYLLNLSGSVITMRCLVLPTQTLSFQSTVTDPHDKNRFMTIIKMDKLVVQDTGLAPAAPLLRGYAKVESLRIAELNDFVITAPSQACQPE